MLINKSIVLGIYYALFSPFYFLGQEKEMFSKNFLNTIDNVQIFVVGEDHSRNNFEHKFELIKLLHKENNLRYVLIEAPRIMEIYANEYLLTGCKKAKKKFKKSFYLNYRKDYMKLLDSLRSFNNNTSKENHLIVRCFDLQKERNSVSYLVLEELFDYLKIKELQKLKSIISDKELNINSKQKKLKAELISNQEMYKEVLGESSYYSLLDYNEGVRIINNSGKTSLSNVKLMKKREEFLFNNINSILKNDSILNMIVFTGNYHISTMDNDPWGEHKTVSQMLSKSDYEILTIYSVYHSDMKGLSKLFNSEFYGEVNLDFERMATKHKNNSFRIINEKDEPDLNELWKRYDALLIKW